MDGGLMTSPPPRFTGPRFGSFQPRGARPDGTYTFNFRAPSVPGQGPNQGCDGKKPRTKVVTRKTVDYNTTVCSYVQNRIWQRDYRDVRSLQPDALYYPRLKPPADMLEHPMNCVTTKHVRTASNKVRCPVFCVCWTPEGRRLITGASSGEFTLWNGLTFSFETILQAHDTPVRSMIWSHNEQWLLSGDHGGYVKYWQLNMNNVKMYQAHKDPVRGLSFSPTDQKYTSCSDDGTVRIWDFLRCHEERIFRGHGADVKCVDWHPTKGLIASGSRDNQQPLILWDPRMGQKLATVHAHKHTVMEVKFNRNGNWLLTASRDHLIKLFDIRNFKEEMQSFKGHMKEATTVAWHPIHESMFASGGSDGQVLFWIVGHEREVGSINDAHDSLIWSAAWHPLGHILVTGSNDHNTKFWTRNRPGDGMRDQYNLNILPAGSEDNPDYVDELHPTHSTITSVPALSTEHTPSEQKDNTQTKTGDVPVIPGLDFSGVSDQTEEPVDENKDTRRKTPYAKHIPRDFVRNWTDGKQPEIISQQLEHHDSGHVPTSHVPSGKPHPPSLLDLPIQMPASLNNPQQQGSGQQDEQQSLPGQQMQQQEMYNEEQNYPQLEQEMPPQLTLPGLGGPVPKELPKGSLLGDWPGDQDDFRTSKNQAFNFASQPNKAALLPSPQSMQQTGPPKQQPLPVSDLSKFYTYQSEIDLISDGKQEPDTFPASEMQTPVLTTGVAKKPDLNAFYNYNEDLPSGAKPVKREVKKTGVQKPGMMEFNKPSKGQGYSKSSHGQGYSKTSQGFSNNSQGQGYSNNSQCQGYSNSGQGQGLLTDEHADDIPAGFQNSEGDGEDQSRDFNQGRRASSFGQDSRKAEDFRNQGKSSNYKRNSVQYNANRPDSSNKDNSFQSVFDQNSTGFQGNGNQDREQRGSWSGNSSSQPLKRGFSEGPGEESSTGGGDWSKGGGGFKSRGGQSRGSKEGVRGGGARGNSTGSGGGLGGSGREGRGRGGRGGSNQRGGRGQKSRGRPR